MDRKGGGVFVGEVDNLGNTGLDDGFGAFVAGEKGDVETTAFEADGVGVEDGVELGVADVEVFAFEILGGVALDPGEVMVGAAVGHAVVAEADDAFVGVGNAGTDLGVGVFAAFGR